MPVIPPPPARTLPAALLCDMDGTLVDTEHQWLDAVAGFLREQGLAATDEVLADFAGAPVDDRRRAPGAHVRGAPRCHPDGCPAGRGLHRQGRVRRHRPAGRAAAAGPGAGLGIPAALVTASERHVADLVLRTLGAHRFALSVTSGEAPRGKPHPDPYLAAAAGLGVDPADCLAVEDTPTGAAAALAAGCRLLAVPSVPGIVPGPRTAVVASLEDVDLADFPFPRPA